MEAETVQPYLQVFEAHELSNEEYHAETDHISGSSLHELLIRSPAGWRFKKDKEAEEKAKQSTGAKQKPLTFGTTGHTCMLEPDRFDLEYYRMPDPDDYPDALTSVAAVTKWLKDKGIAGYSGKKMPELYPLVDMTGEDVMIWQRLWEHHQGIAGEREQVPAKDYDRVLMMRDVLLQNQDFHRIITEGTPELSIFAEIDGVKVKVRIDRITADREIIDYKTTQSAEPEKFGRLAFDNGYYLKMALQHDVFSIAYGAPKAVTLLAQEKEEPFLAEAFELTEEQLLLGRMMYRTALQIYKACRDANKWPSYSRGQRRIKLPTPGYIRARYPEYFKAEK